MTTENTAPASADTAHMTSESAPVEVSNTPVSESAEEPKSSAEDANARWEVTVNGKKLLLSKDEMAKGYGTFQAAQEKFQEAARLRKEAESKLSKLKQNPLEAFIEAGGSESTFRELAEEYLYGKIQYEKMTPEEQELYQLRKYKEEQESRRQAEAKRQEEESISKQAEHLRDNYAKNFTKALSSAGLQPTEKAIARIAQVQLDALEQGYEMPVEAAVELYKEQSSRDVMEYFGALTTEQLIEALGPRVKDIRKHEVAGLKNPTPKERKSSSPSKPSNTSKVSASEFFASLKP